MSYELDEIIPVSRGGDPLDINNVAPAHRCCNQAKSTIPYERNAWNNTEGVPAIAESIKQFECVLTPDFSLYMDMPLPMQQWNEYRRRALGNYWQRNGITVIPTLSWTGKRSFGFCFDGLPHGSTVAVSTVGVKGNDDAMKVWFDGMKAAIKAIEPSCVLLYGGEIGFDFGSIEVIEYKANTAFRR